ncbi:hypothetical protein KC316_g21564, partial [Hortaea werneckii]
MSDKEFSSNDDLSLPKATVQKIITETLSSPALHAHLGINDPNAGNMSFAKETRDL